MFIRRYEIIGVVFSFLLSFFLSFLFYSSFFLFPFLWLFPFQCEIFFSRVFFFAARFVNDFGTHLFQFDQSCATKYITTLNPKTTLVQSINCKDFKPTVLFFHFISVPKLIGLVAHLGDSLTSGTARYFFVYWPKNISPLIPFKLGID